jgi:hypothetical protein
MERIRIERGLGRDARGIEYDSGSNETKTFVLIIFCTQSSRLHIHLAHRIISINAILANVATNYLLESRSS